jgi:ubiquinone/menaquinone biosynthesis C-methylase UbiE
MSLQKTIFIETEGDQWYQRNCTSSKPWDWSQDKILQKALSLSSDKTRILEIGCSDGSRLAQIKKETSASAAVAGIDPSRQAVDQALARGVPATVGTADALPYADASFDIVIFGFCLYLCDDTDLFRIGMEADRVLAPSGWLLIYDFDASAPVYNRYRHREGVMSRKMDYKQMFLWHPAYTLATYEKHAHQDAAWVDDPHEWVSLSCLRKCSRR